MTVAISRGKYSIMPMTLKMCSKCRTPMLGHGWTKKCVNCNIQYANVKKKALLTERQLMDLLDLQWQMMEVNNLLLQKERAEEAANEQRELEEMVQRIRAKYGLNEKASTVETNRGGPGIVLVG